MIETINNPWNEKLMSYVSNTESDIKICCPFIKLDVLKEIYGNKNNNVDFELITRFKIANFYNQVSDIDAIDYMLDKQGSIRAYQMLHAKIFIFDQKFVIITSANLTMQGLTKNYEYGIFTDESSIVSKVCEDFNNLLLDESCVEITKEKVTDAKNIIKNAPPKPSIKIGEIDLGKNHDEEILSNDVYTGGIESIEKGLSGWKLDTFLIINRLEKNSFSLGDVYRYKKELQELHPGNMHIEDKIRQQLQYLRDLEIIEFLGNGRYLKKYVS
jgi:HKD family nuclease